MEKIIGLIGCLLLAGAVAATPEEDHADAIRVLGVTNIVVKNPGYFFYGGEYLSWAFVSGHGAGRAAARYAADRSMDDPEGYVPVDYLAYVQEHGYTVNQQDDDASAATDLLRPAA